MSESLPQDDLTAAVATLHAALDRWHSVVRGVGAEASDTDDALADPRLEAAEAAFSDALGEFHGAAGVALGLSPDDGIDLIEADGDEGEVEGDIFSLQFFVGLTEGRPATELDRVIEVIDAGGYDVVSRLETAGFVVPTFAATRGELAVGLLDPVLDEDDDIHGSTGDDGPTDDDSDT